MKIRDATGEIANETKIDTVYPALLLSLSHVSLFVAAKTRASLDEYRIGKRGTGFVRSNSAVGIN